MSVDDMTRKRMRDRMRDQDTESLRRQRDFWVALRDLKPGDLSVDDYAPISHLVRSSIDDNDGLKRVIEGRMRAIEVEAKR